MDVPRSRLSTGLVLAAGVFLGWSLAALRPVPMHASAGDRSGESIVATGPVMVQFDESTKAPIALDALYLLDYKGGRLVATVPSYLQKGTKAQYLHGFAERDLATDFKLDLDAGPRPRFLMTTGSIGPFSSGLAPLYVFETTTSQVGVYRMSTSMTIGSTTKPRFELLELKSYAKAAESASRP